MQESTVVTRVDSAQQRSLQADTVAGALAIRVAGLALAAGLPIELLLRAEPWGANVALATALAVGALLGAAGPGPDRAVRGGLAAALLALASILAWRAPSLLWLAVVVAMIATMLVLVGPGARLLRGGDPVELAIRLIAALARTVSGPAWLFHHRIDWQTERPRGSGVWVHARGLALATLVVLPFLMLFAAADAAFATLASEVVDLERLASHAILWGAFAWLLLGWLGSAVSPPRVPTIGARVSGREAIWVLGVLVVAFAAFVAVQVRYFFGGEELVRAVTGLTYAEYARQGFFELVTVATLLLGVLLVVDWLARDAAGRARLAVGLLTVALLVLLGVILVSALQRMRLYVAEYGLTQLRMFTTAFMFWLVAVFAWYGGTVLRGARHRFLAGVYVSGVLAVFALAAVDPIARIAQFNVDFRERTGRFDVAHASSLGADAVPVLVASLDRLSPADRCALAPALASWADDDDDSDWRSWNRSRARARAAVIPVLPRLRQGCEAAPRATVDSERGGTEG